MNRRVRILLKGKVQGVGLRPSLYRYARDLALAGWISNSSEGAVIELEGVQEKIATFLDSFRNHLPRESSIEEMMLQNMAPLGELEFNILASRELGNKEISVPPDLGICPDCKRELLSKSDRRRRYPFTNCTACGPRFTILKSIPYDRANTTMSAFPMCPDCSEEYGRPSDRRFHAEPIACAACGPAVQLLSSNGVLKAAREDALKQALHLLEAGKILAIRGLGGFHLACLPKASTVAKLRERKNRPHKPLALMVKDAAALKDFASPSGPELELLTSPLAPIVMIANRDAALQKILAPGLSTLGVMLPYTPLHCLLFEGEIDRLVMTSGNRFGQPICKDTEEALEHLQGIADAFLVHDRPIESRVDDSVMFVMDAKPRFLRRARGAVPSSITLRTGAQAFPKILGVGAELKNAFCFLKGNRATVSQYIGNLSDSPTLEHFDRTVSQFGSLLELKPDLIAHDLHPDYLSTQWALENAGGAKLLAVQHHHAHIASVLAEHKLQGPALGVAFDGTGLGLDRTVWGGEIFKVKGVEFDRAAHLRPFPLLGGDQATRAPWRSAYGLLLETLGVDEAEEILPDAYAAFSKDVQKMAEDKRVSPDCSSMGRLFDAIACIAGLRQECSYEGQAAMELETLAAAAEDLPEKPYAFPIVYEDGRLILDPGPLCQAVLKDRLLKTDPKRIALKFHRALIEAVGSSLRILSGPTGIKTVALSGGCFQNAFLLSGLTQELQKSGFSVYTNDRFPANDGNIALGQVWIAMHEVENHVLGH